tara:strand:+ start:277 stop:531 length:255 start_codon:yes stop_codon:yes gene_type:complete
MKYGIYLDTTHNLEGESKDERIKQVVDGLEHGDVLHKGAVPHDAEKECTDEHNEHKGEDLGEDLGPGLSFGNLLNHLLHVDIFF